MKTPDPQEIPAQLALPAVARAVAAVAAERAQSTEVEIVHSVVAAWDDRRCRIYPDHGVIVGVKEEGLCRRSRLA